MNETATSTATPSSPGAKSMDEIVALCKRRGFIFPASEIYGGINGFWDYGPLGVELKNNLRDAWWHDTVRCPPPGPDGAPLEIVGLDSAIIQNPKVWEASGHVAGFNDPMVDCKACKARFRADELAAVELIFPEARLFVSGVGTREEVLQANRKKIRKLQDAHGPGDEGAPFHTFDALSAEARAEFACPKCGEKGRMTEPRQFNLMFESHAGAVKDEASKVYLRPETAQGIFLNHKSVLDTMRVRLPFGIAQIGKAFRNEVTPRNFTFRSREFEQMEIEFFIHPDSAKEWYAYWRDLRYRWWQDIGLSGDNLQQRDHDRDELAHYAKDGAGTSDVEYRFPFTAPGYGELEGVAHRTDFDLRRHAEFTGKGDKLRYFDAERNEHYFPHVIEPSGGVDRGTLALLCEAYTPTPDRKGSKCVMSFTPRMAPIKAAIFPLVNKNGLPEVAEKLYKQIRRRYVCQFDVKQSIGKRYARMDEVGTPYCFTVDHDTLEQQTVTVRERDTASQERISIDAVEEYLAERIG